MKKRLFIGGLLCLLTVVTVACESDSETTKKENNTKTVLSNRKILNVSAIQLNGKNLVEINHNGKIERSEKFVLSTNEYLINKGNGLEYINISNQQSQGGKLSWYWFADNSIYLGDGTADVECGVDVYNPPMFVVDPKDNDRIMFITVDGITLRFNTMKIKGNVNNGECWELHDPVKTVRRILEE